MPEKIDEWKKLQQNITKILKKKISIKQIKHIVAVINVMQNAGIELKTQAAYPNTTQFGFSIQNIRFECTELPELTSNSMIYKPDFRVDFYIDMNKSLNLDQLYREIVKNLLSGIT